MKLFAFVFFCLAIFIVIAEGRNECGQLTKCVQKCLSGNKHNEDREDKTRGKDDESQEFDQVYDNEDEKSLGQHYGLY